MIREMYIGVFDGKPVFEPRSGIEKFWQTIAELSEKQAPGLPCLREGDREKKEVRAEANFLIQAQNI